jgi:hypothetical protein
VERNQQSNLDNKILLCKHQRPHPTIIHCWLLTLPRPVSGFFLSTRVLATAQYGSPTTACNLRRQQEQGHFASDRAIPIDTRRLDLYLSPHILSRESRPLCAVLDIRLKQRSDTKPGSVIDTQRTGCEPRRWMSTRCFLTPFPQVSTSYSALLDRESGCLGS